MKRGPVVDYSTTGPKVVGSNSACAKIGLRVFHNQHYLHEYRSILTQEAIIESDLAKLYELVYNE